MDSQPSQCLIWMAAKKFSKWLQWTTMVSQHFIRIIFTHESIRDDQTINILISNRGSVSYGAFLDVQKGFEEEFGKNSVKVLQKGVEMKRRAELNRFSQEIFLRGSKTQPVYQSTCQGSYLSSKSIGMVVRRVLRIILSETWASIRFFMFFMKFSTLRSKL